MKNQSVALVALILLASTLCFDSVRSHHYGQPRMTRPAPYYSTETASLSDPNSPASPPQPMSPTPAPSQPTVKPGSDNPTSTAQQQQQQQQRQLLSGFQPSVPSFQRGTQKFTDGVRQGLVQGLEEFLGVPPGQRIPNPTGSSVTYANQNQLSPGGVSYHAPAPFIYGNPHATYSNTPVSQSGYVASAPVSQSGYVSSHSGYVSSAPAIQSAYVSSAPSSQSGYVSSAPVSQSGYVVRPAAPAYRVRTAQSSPGQSTPEERPRPYLGAQSSRSPQQPPSHTSWFRQSHGAVQQSSPVVESSLGRYAPASADYQQPGGQGGQSSAPVTTYVDGSQPRQYQPYAYQ